MSIFGAGHEVVTYATRPAAPSIGQVIYQTDTDEFLKYTTDVDGTVRWMQMNDNPRRNLVINGSFDVWQRGTSFNPASSSTLSRANYGADRWQMVQATTSAAAFTQQANTPSGPAGYNFYTRVQRVAAATLVTPYLLFTSFESQNLRSVRGKFVTLSFWARAGANYSAASSGLSVQVAGGVGTDNTYDNFSTPFGVASSAFTLTTGWKRFTLTSAATLSTTTSQLGIRIAFTPVGTAGADDYFDITGVQLEVGTAPTDFEFRDVGEELVRCQRYYEKSYDLTTTPGTNTAVGLTWHEGATHGDGTMGINAWFRVPKRTSSYTPSFWTQTGTAGSWNYVRNGGSSTMAMTTIYIGENQFSCYGQTGATWAAAYAYGHWAVSAEL